MVIPFVRDPEYAPCSISDYSEQDPSENPHSTMFLCPIIVHNVKGVFEEGFGTKVLHIYRNLIFSEKLLMRFELVEVVSLPEIVIVF